MIFSLALVLWLGKKKTKVPSVFIHGYNSGILVYFGSV
jgi:hypothetical protein